MEHCTTLYCSPTKNCPLPAFQLDFRQMFLFSFLHNHRIMFWDFGRFVYCILFYIAFQKIRSYWLLASVLIVLFHPPGLVSTTFSVYAFQELQFSFSLVLLALLLCLPRSLGILHNTIVSMLLSLSGLALVVLVPVFDLGRLVPIYQSAVLSSLVL